MGLDYWSLLTSNSYQCSLPNTLLHKSLHQSIVSYAGFMQMQWGVRACKTTEEENFVCCTTTRGQQFTATVNWELELSNAGFIHGIREKHFKLAKQANANHTSIKFSYSHSMTYCATLDCSVTSHCVQPWMLYVQPLLRSITSKCWLGTLNGDWRDTPFVLIICMTGTWGNINKVMIQAVPPWICDLINYCVFMEYLPCTPLHYEHVLGSVYACIIAISTFSKTEPDTQK